MGAADPITATVSVDPLELRRCLGQFPTGVTIVTTTEGDGTPTGMTASSFNTLSLDPPLVLWSIDRKAGCFDAFDQGAHFAIHVLTEADQDLALRFASRGGDKFAGLAFEAGIGEVPLLDHYCARFECAVENRFDGGDHVILVGRVQRMTTRSAAPLVFHRGNYSRLETT